MHFLSFLYNVIDLETGEGIINYIHMLSKLPTRNTKDPPDWTRFDARTKNNKQISAKAGRMVSRTSLKTMPTNPNVRVRYFIKNKIHNHTSIDDGIYLCKCTKTMQIDGKRFSAFAFSERKGYDVIMSRLRQLVINSMLRRT
jgi:hypothetical protein